MSEIEIAIKCLEYNDDDQCSGLKERHITFSTNGETATLMIDKKFYSFGRNELKGILELLNSSVETNITIDLLRKQNINLTEENLKLKRQLK